MIMYDHVYIDTETTGLNPTTDEILAVGAIEYNMSGEIGRSMSCLCRPESGVISKGASDVNHITYNMVKNEKSWLKDGVRVQYAKFIGKRTLVGHNIVKFDSKFLKIEPTKMIDTLLMAREIFPNMANKLSSACKRVNIEFDDKLAHDALYDTKKGLELHLKLNKIKLKESNTIDLPLFTQEKPVLFNIQAWSYSRLNLFHTCPFKWYMIYVKKEKEPDYDYFKVGSVCHEIASEAGKWCYRRTIMNKIIAFKGRDLTFDPAIILDDPLKIKEYFPECSGLYDLIYKLDGSITDYEKVSMPDREEYDRIINTALVNYSIIEPEMISEIKYIMDKFYIKRDFSLSINGVLITEKKIALDKDWKVVDDYFGKDVWVRFVVDVIKYYNDTVVITDYKSSRTMLNEKDLKNDPQLKLYALAVYQFLPKDSFKKMILKIDYIRFCKEIIYEVDNVEGYINEAKQWIVDSIKLVENGPFEPKRNSWCGTCFLSENGECPLFSRKFINNIGDPVNFSVKSADDCVAAFKTAEVLDIERKGLVKKCQDFIKSTDVPVIIDKDAKLGFYTKPGIEVSAEKFALLMLKKGFKMVDFIGTFGVTKTSLDWIQKRLKVTLTKEELESISEKKGRVEFDALTEKELEKYVF
jgi:DNA polymerase III epsilon subunit-like protein